MIDNLICVIRIEGEVGLREKVKNSLDRIRLKRKYSCVILRENSQNVGLLKKLKDFVAFGHIKKDVLVKLIEKRGKLIDKKKKISPAKIIEEFEKGKSFKELNLKPFFRLHPPRKGIKSKLHYPKGVLGNHGKKINELIERML